MIQLSPTEQESNDSDDDPCEILATEDREESQQEELIRNSEASEANCMKRISMKRNRDVGASSIN